MEAIGGGSSLSKKLTAESEGQLREAIFLVLSRWSALQLAIENEWAGPSSNRLADQLVSDIFSWFTCSKEPLYIDDLENILDEGMLSLNVMTEDGSVEEVAEKLMILHEECLEGNYSGIEELRQTRTGTEVHQHIRKDIKLDGIETTHFVLVHGGGFGDWCWYKTVALLEESGYRVSAIDLTGSGIHSFDTNGLGKNHSDLSPNLTTEEQLGHFWFIT